MADVPAADDMGEGTGLVRRDQQALQEASQMALKTSFRGSWAKEVELLALEFFYETHGIRRAWDKLDYFVRNTCGYMKKGELCTFSRADHTRDEDNNPTKGHAFVSLGYGPSYGMVRRWVKNEQARVLKAEGYDILADTEEIREERRDETLEDAEQILGERLMKEESGIHAQGFGRALESVGNRLDTGAKKGRRIVRFQQRETSMVLVEPVAQAAPSNAIEVAHRLSSPGEDDEDAEGA